jgi:hypothetical protein
MSLWQAEAFRFGLFVFHPFILPASVEQPVFGKKVGKEQKSKRYMDRKMPGSGRLGRRLYFS